MQKVKTLLCINFACLLYKSSSAQKIDSLALSGIPPERQLQVNKLLVISNRNKAWGWGLLGGGIAFSGIWFYMEANNVESIEDPSQMVEEEGLKGQNLVAVLAISLSIVSIPCFTMSRRTLNEAKLLLYSDKVAWLSPGVALPNSASAGVRLVISLGK